MADQPISIVRRIQFCAGHRVFGHENKCANLHGHNYVVYFHVRTKELDPIGRVIDFSVIKDLLGGWLERNWDHAFLFWSQDKVVMNVFEQEGTVSMRWWACNFNPTAENMATFMLNNLGSLLPAHLQLHKVVLWETENCYAEVSL